MCSIFSVFSVSVEMITLNILEFFSVNSTWVSEKAMATHASTLAWKTHGQRSLAGYSPWGVKESDTTKQLSNNKKYLINLMFI